ncbi:TonB-dependent receptor [Owenweeksia hongkongensis]|uniref:TonB-dependent receptor n=1 Tax=Owenweeksia hongkongensis TaxID=253245 RepID=UPI003A8F5AED
MKIKYTLSLVICLFFSALAFAQTGKVRGFVIDKESDAPIPFANVVVQGLSIGAVANDEGYFILSNVPLGKQTIEISFVGYETITEEVVVSEVRIASVKIYMGASSELLQDVEVSADRQERETKVLTGVVSLDPKEIQQFSVGGDADIIKAIQVLPGVVTTGDQGGQLYIRGGAPIQNLITLDGMIVYNPFHSIGFFSVFDADIIQSADVYSGGFNAEYGSRNSAVMDVRTRVANRKEMSGKVFASTYSSKLLLETPMGKKNERGMAPVSLMVSAKTSYLEQSSQVFYPYVETEYDGLPFNFTDVYAKLSSQSDNGSKFNVFGFSFDDGVRFASDNSIDWNSLGAGFNFTAVPASSSVLIDGGASYSNYEIVSIEGAGESPKESSISGFNGGLDFTYFLRENDQFKYGLEAITYRTALKLPAGDFLPKSEEIQNTTELGAYAQYKFTAKRLIIEPGFRVHYYGSQDEISLEPRLGLKYTINDWLRLKASGGLYSQNLVASNSDRDVVNLFYGFLSGPDDVPSTFRGETIPTALQKAKHVVAGLEIEVSKEITLNIEGYIKDFDQITNVNRNQIYASDNNDPDIAEIYKTKYIVEQGLAQGIDLLATYRTKKLYLWAAYSLSKVTRDDGLQEYYPYFDRRHNLNLVGNYTFGKEGTWEFSLRYNFGTGFPFTPTQGYYSQLTFIDNTGNAQPSQDLTTTNGNPAVIYGDLNDKRLPNYHRVDVSIKKTITLKNENVLELSAGATNILNYENIFYWDREENKRVNQLPIMPTVSLAYSF